MANNMETPYLYKKFSENLNSLKKIAPLISNPVGYGISKLAKTAIQTPKIVKETTSDLLKKASSYNLSKKINIENEKKYLSTQTYRQNIITQQQWTLK